VVKSQYNDIYCHGILPVGLNKITKFPRYVRRTPERNLKHEIHTYEAELDHDTLMYIAIHIRKCLIVEEEEFSLIWLSLEDEGATFLRNPGNHQSSYTMSCAWIQRNASLRTPNPAKWCLYVFRWQSRIAVLSSPQLHNEAQLNKMLSRCMVFRARRLTKLTPYNYEGWNFNSGNYLFTTDTK